MYGYKMLHLIYLQLPCDTMWQLQLAGCSSAPGGATDMENRAMRYHQPASSTCTTAPSEENSLLGLTKPILWLNNEFSLTPLTQQAGDLLAFVKHTQATLQNVWRSCPRSNAPTTANSFG